MGIPLGEIVHLMRAERKLFFAEAITQLIYLSVDRCSQARNEKTNYLNPTRMTTRGANFQFRLFPSMHAADAFFQVGEIGYYCCMSPQKKSPSVRVFFMNANTQNIL